MNMKWVNIMFDLDDPITTVKEDQEGLNRNNFAENLAKNINNHYNQGEVNECLVIGLMGEWGDGKTSVLNLTKNHLKEINPNIEIVNFHPWLYSSYNQLIHLFFEDLINGITDANLKGELIKYSLKLDKLSLTKTIISEAIGSFNNGLKNVFEEFVPKNSEEKTLNQLKNSINKKLKNHKVLCIIDDIDRLTKEEISEMFRLLKIIANFNNTIYLVAFDKKVVSDALNTIHKDGEKYIEKIINVPLELSAITTLELENIFMKKINETIKKFEIKNYNEHRLNSFLDFYDDDSSKNLGVIYLFSNLRDITRFFNILKFNIELIKEEVNFEDFITITAIQVFKPEIYNNIKNNEFLFTEYTDNEFFSDESRNKKISTDKKEYKKLTGKNLNLNGILTKLFPKIHHIYHPKFTSVYVSDFADSNLLICHPNHFKSYFKLNDNLKIISEYEINFVIAQINENNNQQLMLEFKRLDSEGKLNEFISLLRNRINRISEDSYKSFLNSLFRLELNTFKNTIPIEYIENIIIELIYRFKPEERFKIIKETYYNNSQNIIILSKLVRFIKNNNYNPLDIDGDPILTDIEINHLKEFLIQKYKDFAHNKTFTNTINLPILLGIGKKLDLNDEVNKIINNLISTEKGFIFFLNSSFNDYRNLYHNDSQLVICMNDIIQHIPIEEINDKIIEYNLKEDDSDLVDIFTEGCKLLKES